MEIKIKSRKCIINPLIFDKWIKQNKIEITEGFDGCLLDNYFGYNKKFAVAIYETFETTNSSVYTVYMETIGSPEARDLENAFYERMEEALKQIEQ